MSTNKRVLPLLLNYIDLRIEQSKLPNPDDLAMDIADIIAELEMHGGYFDGEIEQGRHNPYSIEPYH